VFSEVALSSQFCYFGSNTSARGAWKKGVT
jgi:hypothetical protein